MLAYLLVAWALVHAVLTGMRFGTGSVTLGAGFLFLSMLIQAVLGIATLLAKVPVELGLIHQAMAILVFSLALWHLSQLVPVPAPGRR
jgi:cytochrome c oxidase assembly protein subunit 15